LSYNYSTSLASCTILLMCALSSYSLWSWTSGGVVGVNFSMSSMISYLYFSMSCAILWNFPYGVTFGSYAQSGMLLYTYVNPFSNFCMRLFSSSFSGFNWSQVICNTYVTSFPTSKLVASARALDWNSCIALSCSMYSAFIGICTITISSWYMSLMGFYVVSSSILSI
jgi:hypothetical protein